MTPSDQEPVYDILIFDIGGALLAASVGYIFHTIRLNYYKKGFKKQIGNNVFNCFTRCFKKEPVFVIESDDENEITNKTCMSNNAKTQWWFYLKVFVTIMLSIQNCEVVPDIFTEWKWTLFIDNSWVLIVLWYIVNCIYILATFYNKNYFVEFAFIWLILTLTFLTAFACRSSITWPPAVVCLLVYVILIGIGFVWGIFKYITFQNNKKVKEFYEIITLKNNNKEVKYDTI